MGHCIQAIILRNEDVASFRAGVDSPQPLMLPQGFAMIPMFDAFIDRIDPEGDRQAFEGFTFLGSRLHQRLSDLSASCCFIVYIETDYWGGDGAQGAASYDRGRVVFGPEHQESGPINKALAAFGVVRGEERDEFDALGLGRFRRMDDFAEYEKYEAAEPGATDNPGNSQRKREDH